MSRVAIRLPFLGEDYVDFFRGRLGYQLQFFVKNLQTDKYIILLHPESQSTKNNSANL